MGAEIIEKHIIPSYKYKNWTDAESSLDVNDFSKMVFKLKNLNKAYGSKKEQSLIVKKNGKLKLIKVYATKDIKMGETLNSSNILIRN